MTKQSAAQPAIALTPGLSLRHAVRPLIFAHALLSREQEQAGELAAECERILQLTRKLLEAAALVHLLVPGDNSPATDGFGVSKQTELIDAYANAGIIWAEVVGCAVALADILIGQGRWEDVRRLADFLEAAEEPSAAENLRTRADAAARRASEERLGQINARMTADEIARAIEALEAAQDEGAVRFYIRDLALAISGILPSSWRKNYDMRFAVGYVFSIHWAVKAGDRVTKGQNIGLMYPARPSSTYSQNPSPLTIPFAAIIVELLVLENSVQKADQPTGSVALASVIEVPQPLAAELERTETSAEAVFSRLEALTRVYRQIQAENNRTMADSN